ncbi:hypothetical protein PRIPAC_74357 [Pristionchus pacificus]|uniref:Uncharacterized protein n=1 Tax=Pristionchus pacificus TaxID=54126 RepID=A0A2A6C6K8_PRIPA|nr:hypothetical protein PRIPAC_74357 [Pristionchus pacificus]|eukprot:PDM73815.1 hypothetical protein PRIPAC_41171 [Pristionchus pacificus]
MPRVNYKVELILQRRIEDDGSKSYLTRYMPVKGHVNELPSWQPESNFIDTLMIRMFDRYVDDPNKSADWMKAYEKEVKSTYEIMEAKARKEQEEKEKEKERIKKEKEAKKEAKRNAILASLAPSTRGTRSRSNRDAAPDVTKRTTSRNNESRDQSEEDDEDDERLEDDGAQYDDGGDDDGDHRRTFPTSNSSDQGYDVQADLAPGLQGSASTLRFLKDAGMNKSSDTTIAVDRDFIRNSPIQMCGTSHDSNLKALDSLDTTSSMPSSTDPVLKDPFEFTEDDDIVHPAISLLANLRKQKNGEEVPACADPQPAGNQRRSSSATKRNRSGEAAHFEMGNDEPQITPDVKRNRQKTPRDDPMKGDQEIKEEVTDEQATAYLHDQKFARAVPSCYGTRGSSEGREENQAASEREMELLEQDNSALRKQHYERESTLEADLKKSESQTKDLIEQTVLILEQHKVYKETIKEIRQRNEELEAELAEQKTILGEKHQEIQKLIEKTNRRTFNPLKNDDVEKAVLVNKLRQQIADQDETIEKLTRNLEKASLNKSPPPPASQEDMAVDKLVEEQPTSSVTDSNEASACSVNLTQQDKGEHRTYFSLKCEYGFPLPLINMSCNDCIKIRTKCRGSLGYLWQFTLQRLIYWSKDEMRIIGAIRRALPATKPPTTTLFSSITFGI